MIRSFLDFLKVALASILFDVSKIPLLSLRRREGIMGLRRRGSILLCNSDESWHGVAWKTGLFEA